MKRLFLPLAFLLIATIACTLQQSGRGTQQALPVPTAISPPVIASPTLTAATTRPDGAELIFAPSAPASAQNPLFSPDGQAIVFTLFHDGYNVGPAGLYYFPSTDGSLVTLLDEVDHNSVNLPGSAWNAATNRIAFASDREDTDEIWTMNADGSDLFRVTHSGDPLFAIEPSFSPDGQWIVFEVDTNATEDEQQGSIWKVCADGSELTQLTDGPGGGTDDRQPNWSPAGDRVLFQRRIPGSEDWNIYTMSPDGTDIKQVTDAPSSDTDASWSPDGRWIVYSSDYGGLAVPNLFIISAIGGTPIRVTRDDTHGDGAASWSPDGKWIAFESYPSGGEESPASLWRIAAPPTQPPPSTAPTAPANGGIWIPAPNTTWQWQLTDPPVDQSFDVDVYDIELFDNDASVVAALHAQGRKVICYVSVGSWEDWRPDKDQFPPEVIGKDYKGWPGEKWLDIRRIDVLGPIMQARLDQCKAKGFDAVEPDNIDGYTNDTGFPLTYEDQLNYNIWLANESHARGLSIGLKNDPEQAAGLVAYFDWALTEDCFAEGWCEQMLPFIEAGKAVFAAEYIDTGIGLEEFCPQAQAMKLSAILKNRELDVYREACP
ncbi:MAG: endo alpha-1,4 polygalactosaminidase [Chloroflexota bacterium]